MPQFSSPKWKAAIAALSLVAVSPTANAAPTAVADTFSVAEDSSLDTTGQPLLNATFDGGGVLDDSWDYLDRIENAYGADDDYPTDGSGRNWRTLDFDTASSTVGPWSSGTSPLQSGNIDAFPPETPDTLFGIDDADNGLNLITTYLFRNTVVLSSAQASTANWILEHVLDDGAIVYINGSEVLRANLPAGAITAATQTGGSTPNETSYTMDSVNLSGVLVAGTNIVAVELHQSDDTSSDIGFDLRMRPDAGGGTDGFSYVDDVFGTSEPGLSSGDLQSDGGASGAGLHVRFGGSNNGASSSGGWEATLDLPSNLLANITVDYRLLAANNYEGDEFSECMFEIDGTSYGPGGADYLARFVGNGNGGPDQDTGWQTYSVSLLLTRGLHTFTVGGFNNKATTGSEVSDVWFDNIIIEDLGGGDAGVLENDSGNTATLTAVLESQPSDGTLAFNSDGTFLYSPDANFFGQDSFTYHAVDDTGSSAPVTVTITVSAVNDPPQVNPRSYAVAEDMVLSVPAATGLLVGASDIEGQTILASLSSPPSNGTASVNANGSFTYTPATGFAGTDTFQFVGSDGSDLSEPATVTITVTAVNDPPVAVDDSYSVMENTTLVVGNAGVGGQVGSFIVPLGAVWRYLDNGSDQGTAWRAVAFNDGGWAQGAAELGYGDGDEDTEVSFGPDSGDKYVTTYFRRSFTIGNPLGFTGLTARLKDDDGSAVYLNGTEVFRNNLSAGAAYDTYADGATGDESAIDTFQIDLALLQAGENVLAVEIHQATPSSSDISFDYSLEGFGPLGVLNNDSDPEGAMLVAALVDPPSSGTLDLESDGTFVYTPAANFFGTDSFVYAVSDGESTQEATVNITVDPGPNDPPVAVDDVYAVPEDGQLVIGAVLGVLSNDSDNDGDPMTAAVSAPPGNGTLSLAASGAFTYTPDPDFFGQDQFLYVTNDGQDDSQPATVRINVLPGNDPPMAVLDVYAVQPGQSLTVDAASGVLANDHDPDGDTLSAVLSSTTPRGSLSLQSSGAFTYTPNVGTQDDSFMYVASDGTGQTPATLVVLVVSGRPVANPDTYTVMEDQTLNIGPATGVLQNDSDPESETLTALLISPPAAGSLTLDPDGSFTYEPQANASGSVSFSYAAADPLQNSIPTTVNIQITAVNDAPDAEDDSYPVLVDTTLVIGAAEGVLANDTDVDNASLSATLVSGVAHGTLSLNANGGFSYTPDPGYNGGDQFTYRANDGSANSPVATVTLEVAVDNDAIVINEIMYNPANGNPLDEYIELKNVSLFDVNLEGWSFSSGVSYTFPNVSVPAGGFIVVAADQVRFASVYANLPNLIGGWTGRLSNSGERIRLKNAQGDQIDELSYSDEGDWAQRVRDRDGGEDGWDWQADHDGGGQSLELIFPGLSNRNGANWRASSAPTPGAENSVAAADIAPLISNVRHDPPVPRSNQPVSISAEVKEVEGVDAVVTLRYRTANGNPGAFASAIMRDDGLSGDNSPGDGVYGVVLPARPDGTVIEFYVEASDGVLSRSWPAPTDLGQLANCHYQVDNFVHDSQGHQGIYRIVLTEEDENDWEGFSSGSNAKVNVTLIVDDCSGPVIRYRSGMRIRGASSRGHNPRPMRLEMPRDDDWQGIARMNLNPKYTYLQDIGMKLMHASDLRAPEPRRIRVLRNGDDISRGDEFDYGSWVHLQPGGSEFATTQYADDPDGNFYKKVRPDVQWAYRNGNVGAYMGDGWSKGTNGTENDWTDLDNFLDVMNNASSGPDYLDAVSEVADIDQWMLWFGAENLMANGETNISNGVDDDYSMYRGAIDQRFKFVAHDLDTILAIGDGSRITDPQNTLFDMTERGSAMPQLGTLFGEPTIRTQYFRALRTLVQTSFSKPQFDELLDNELAGWVPDSVLSDIKQFMDARRSYAEGEINAALGAPPATTQPTTIGVLNSPRGNVFLSEILAVNTSIGHEGTFPDLIELQNLGASEVSLAGMSISDDPDDPAKFVFPAGTSIASGGFLLLIADSEPTSGLHTGFGLDADGEVVTLYTQAGTAIDSIAFGPQIPDRSIGRTGAGLQTWRLTNPTFGSPNTTAAVGNPSSLFINEWFAKPDITWSDDFIELYNADGQPVALGGLAITDEPAIYPRRFELPPLSFIAGGGFCLFRAEGGSATAGNWSELPFKLEADGGWLAIFGSNGVEIDKVSYHCERNDVSQGRRTNGNRLYRDFDFPSPGLSNTANLSVERGLVENLRITELMYNPPGGSDLEYLELTNIGTSALVLTGVEFTDGISFVFPGTALAPGASGFLVSNQAAYEGAYGTDTTVLGVYTGRLSNGGERIRLEIPAFGAGIMDFDYDDAWYPTTDGIGDALEIVDANAERGRWNERSAWRARSVQITGGYSTWVAGQFATGDPNVTGPLRDPDCDGVPNLVEYGLGTDPNDSSTAQMPQVVDNGGFLVMEFTRSSLAPDASVIVEVSSDAVTWVSGGQHVVETLIGTDGSRQIYQARDVVSRSSSRRRYMRVKVIGQ